MKKIMLVLVLMLAVFSADSSFSEFMFSFTGSVSNARVEMRVPFNSSMQEVIQLTGHEIFSDSKGDFISIEGHFNFTALIKVNSSNIIIYEDPAFPFSHGFEEFTQATETIDITQSVAVKAAEIAGGGNSTLEIAADVLKWTYESVEYDLSSAGGRRMKASDVFRERRGVCGDFAVLTASMLRSLGIPAKYATGFLVHSEDSVEAHAWIEVFIPGSGWVPVDPTNGHFMPRSNLVLLSSGRDPVEASDVLHYSGANPKYDKKPADIKVLRKEEFSGFFNLAPVLLENEVGFGSSADLNVYVRSKKNHFTVPDLKVASSQGLFQDKRFDLLVLPPLSEKMSRFSFITPSDLDEGFIYSYFIRISVPGETAEEVLNTSFSADVVQRAGLRINDVSIDTDRGVSVSVELLNYGSRFLNSVSVSVSGETEMIVQKTDLSPGERKTLVFDFKSDENPSFFYIKAEAEDIVLSKSAPFFQIKEQSPLEERFSKAFIYWLLILILFLLLLPFAKRSGKPVYTKHSKKRKIQHSFEFLSRNEEHGISELKKKGRRKRS